MRAIRHDSPVRSAIGLLFATAVLLGGGIAALAGPIDPAQCTVSMPYLPAGTSVSVCANPAGTGYPLTRAFRYGAPGGSTDLVNATVQVMWRDSSGGLASPPAACDVWIEAPGLFTCPLYGCAGGGAHADDTISGSTSFFSGAPFGGGHSTPPGGTCQVYWWDGATKRAVGDPLPIFFNSPDINGDGAVNLTDTVAVCNAVVSGSYSYRCDFWADGKIDLSDVVLYTQALGNACP